MFGSTFVGLLDRGTFPDELASEMVASDGEERRTMEFGYFTRTVDQARRA